MSTIYKATYLNNEICAVKDIRLGWCVQLEASKDFDALYTFDVSTLTALSKLTWPDHFPDDFKEALQSAVKHRHKPNSVTTDAVCQ